MRRKRVVVPLLLAMLTLGLLAAGAVAGASTGTDTDSVPTATATTGDTTGGTTGDTTTSTTGTTTSDTVTTAPVDETTTQASTTPTDTTQAPPAPAPCDTTQITCGNNAATQIAIVSQNCQSTSANSAINVVVTTMSGAPVNNFTIANTTTCLNQLSITQVVQQFCVGCTVIVIPPPPATVVVQTQISAPIRARAFYCTAATPRTMVELDLGQPDHDSTYAGAVLATIDPSGALRCPGSAVTQAAVPVPVFTLTVPASLVGQTITLCVQSSAAGQKPICRKLKIVRGATISIPVTANVVATLSPVHAQATKAKTPAQLAAASRAYTVKPKPGKRHSPKHKKAVKP